MEDSEVFYLQKAVVEMREYAETFMEKDAPEVANWWNTIADWLEEAAQGWVDTGIYSEKALAVAKAYLDEGPKA